MKGEMMVKKILCFLVLTIILNFSNVLALELQIVSDPFAPLGYESRDGEIVGLTVDVIRALLEETEIKGKFLMLPWARAYHMAKTEENILIYSLVKTEERQKIFKLVGPFLHERAYLYKLKKRKDIRLDSLDDIWKYRVGVVNEYYAHQYLVSEGFEELLDIAVTPELNLKKFIVGRFDLLVYGEVSFNYHIKEKGYDPDIFEKVLYVMLNEKYLAFSQKTDDEIVKRFEQALKRIKLNGTLEKITRKYLEIK